MRSYLTPDKFFSKMKKKPALQSVLDDLDNYTEEQLQSLTGTHFPQWIKDQLIKRKSRNGKTSDEVAYDIAMKMIAASQRDNTDN